jgi:hypothetical protein
MENRIAALQQLASEMGQSGGFGGGYSEPTRAPGSPWDNARAPAASPWGSARPTEPASPWGDNNRRGPWN